MSDALETLNRELAKVGDYSAPSATKWNRVSEALSPLLSLTPEKIYFAYVSKAANLSVRLTQPGAMKRRPDVAFALLEEAGDLQACIDQAPRLLAPRGIIGSLALCTQNAGAWDVRVLLETRRGIGLRVAGLFPGAQHQVIQPAPIAAASRSPAGSLAVVPLLVDARTKRMVRLAIASSPAVLLVGPPGTGKTKLLREVISEIADSPGRFGFTASPQVRWVTPEESWTTRELIGGETVDDQGRLRFRPGHVLNAIRDNHWLVLDEANRADMDKIFGGLLTWLSGQDVELGKAATALDAPAITLEWAEREECRVEGLEQLDTATGHDAIRFIAGTSWRLLGTYNALDAQRVFRFGQALGRRFVRVPIPPMGVTDFRQILDSEAADLAEQVRAKITRLYEAHLASPATLLGPALFLWIPEYVRAGLELKIEEPAAQPDADRLVIEAYLASAGTWLSRLDDAELEALRARVTPELFSASDWHWLTSMLPHLG